MTIAYPDEHFTVKTKYRGENSHLPGAKEALDTLAAYERLMEATRKEVDTLLGQHQPADSSVTRNYQLSRLSRLSKRDALAIAFQTIGSPAKNKALYQFLKTNGHPVASCDSMNVILRECPEFVNVSYGVWKHVPENRGIPGTARRSGVRIRLTRLARAKRAEKATGA